MAATGETVVDDGLNALSWVHDELRRSLEAAHKALRRYLKEAAESTDLDPVDPSVLRQARAQLHQGVGAVELVGLGPAAAVLRASEAALHRLSMRPRLITPATVEAIERGSHALLDYIARRLADKPVSPLALFPQYRALQELAGASRIHPADLWPTPWSWREVAAEPHLAPRHPDAQTLSLVESDLLALMRGAPPSVAARMSEVFAELASGALQPLRAGAPESDARRHRHVATLWQLASAFFESQADGLLALDTYSKRIGSRLLAQLRAGEDAEPSARLAHDLLFFCSQATPRSGLPVLGLGQGARLAAVRAAWGLTDEMVVDFAVPRLGRFDPALVSQARKRVAAAKEVWSAVAGGDLARLVGLTEQMALVGESLQRLYPEGTVLGRALHGAAAHAVAQGAEPSAELAMEVATALLYLDASLDDSDFDHPDVGLRLQRLAQRIDQVRQQRDPGVLELWMEDLYRRVSNRQTMGSVVQELRATLSEVEKHIDQYFRSPSQRDVLIPVPAQLQAMRGVLSVLGLDQASQAVLRMRDDVDALSDTEADPQRALQSGSFERLADNLGALSFLIDMVAVQPQMAKSLFRFNAETGSLSAVMARQERASGFADLGSAELPGLHPEAARQSPDTDALAVTLEFDRIVQQARVQQRGAGPSGETGSTGLPMVRFADSSRRAGAESQAGRSSIVSVFDPVAGPQLPASAAASPAPDDVADDPEMRAVFLDEARDIIGKAREQLEQLDQQPAERATLTAVRRAFHTLKGSARMVGLRRFGEASWACEQVYNNRLADHAPADAPLLAFSTRALHDLEQWVDAIAAGDDSAFQPQPLMQAAEGLLAVRPLPSVPLLPPLSQGAADGAAAEAQRGSEPAPESDWQNLPPLPALTPQGRVPGLQARVPDLPSATDLDLPPLPGLAPGPLATPAPGPAGPSTDALDTLPAHWLDPNPPSLPRPAVRYDDDRPTAPAPDLSWLPEDEADGAAAFTAEPLPSQDLPALPALPSLPGPAAAPAPVVAFEATMPLSGPGALPDLAATSVATSLAAQAYAAPPQLPLINLADLDDAAPAHAVAPSTPSAPPDPAGLPAVPGAGTVPGYTNGLAALAPAAADGSDLPPLDLLRDLTVNAPTDLPFGSSAGVNAGAPAEPAQDAPDSEHIDLAFDAPGPAPALTPPNAPASDDLDLLLDQPFNPAAPPPDDLADPGLDLTLPDEPLPAGAVDLPLDLAATQAPVVMPFLPSGLQTEPLLASLDDPDAFKQIGPLRISIALFNIFIHEADELSRQLGTLLAEWRFEPDQPVSEGAVARAHSLAGNAATVGYTALSDLSRALEHALERSHQRGHAQGDEPELFVRAADEVRRLLHLFAAGFLNLPDPEIRHRLDQLAHAAPEPDGLADADDEGVGLPSAFRSSGFGLPDPGLRDFGRSSLMPFVAQSDLAQRARPSGEGQTALGDDIDTVDAIDAELFPVFEEEALELLPRLHAGLRDWAQRPGDPQAASACMRSLHTFKGGARLAGAMRLGELAHRLETAIERLTARQVMTSTSDVEALMVHADELDLQFDTLRGAAPAGEAAEVAGASSDPMAEASASASPSTDQAAALPAPPALVQDPLQEPVQPAASNALLAGVQALVPAPAPEPLPAIAEPPAAAPETAAAAAVPPLTTAAPTPPARTVPMAPAARTVPVRQPDQVDWQRFLHSAPELLEEPLAARPAAGSVRVRAALLDRLVGHAGEVSIARSRIETDVQQFKGALADLTDNLERLRSQLRDIELQAETQIGSRLDAARAAQRQFDPLEMDRFTRFQELTRMMAESVGDVATVQRSLQRTLQTTEDTLAHQSRMTREMQDDLLRTRLVEFEGLSERLYRVVRQAAKETNKPVRLDIVGGSIEVDRGVLDRMTPAFEHLLRNSVVHGIESPEQRAAAGKDATGTVTVTVGQIGNEVAVEVRDDGGGLHLDRIRERAVALGLLAPEAQPGEAELANLIFQPGFTTATEVTEMAGRGVGMDVVRTEVNAIGGRIETASAPGQGASFRLVLPLTTAVTQVVMLRCGERAFAVPSTLVETVTRVPAAEVEACYQQGTARLGERELPFFWLDGLLQGSPRCPQGSSRTASLVVVRSADRRVVLQVDEVMGNQEVVVKHLGPQLARLPGLVGVTLLPSGLPAMIYNPVALATHYGAEAHARVRAASLPAGAAAGAVAPDGSPLAPLVLVVDDSLTVRRVTQRLLEREGYRVALAKDGRDALDKLTQELPRVVLSDIEMPRMDGFDLVRNLRADPRLAALPVVMITSRLAQKHRDYAAQLGVNHYLGKPYAEDELLGLVARYAPRPVLT